MDPPHTRQDSLVVIYCVTNALSFACQPPGVVVTESQTFKKRLDFQSNDDYAVYVRENIQVRSYISLLTGLHMHFKMGILGVLLKC